MPAGLPDDVWRRVAPRRGMLPVRRGGAEARQLDEPGSAARRRRAHARVVGIAERATLNARAARAVPRGAHRRPDGFAVAHRNNERAAPPPRAPPSPPRRRHRAVGVARGRRLRRRPRVENRRPPRQAARRRRARRARRTAHRRAARGASCAPSITTEGSCAAALPPPPPPQKGCAEVTGTDVRVPGSSACGCSLGRLCSRRRSRASTISTTRWRR